MFDTLCVSFHSPNRQINGITLSSKTMGLRLQAFSTTHGSTMLHSLVYIKICMNHINLSNFNRAKFTRKTDQNGSTHGKN